MGIGAFTSARDLLLRAADRELTGEEACTEIASAIRRVAPYDAAAVMTTDPDTNLPAGGMVTGFDGITAFASRPARSAATPTPNAVERTSTL